MWKNEEPSYSTLTNFLKSVKVGRLVGGDNLKYSGIPFDKITSYFLVGHNLDRLKSIRTINYSLKYLTEEQIEKIEEIREKYVNSGKIELFDKDLKSSKNNLNNGLRYVYFSSSIAGIIGIIISIFIFPKPALLRILIRKKS